MKRFLKAHVPQDSSLFQKKQKFSVLIFLSSAGIRLGQTKKAQSLCQHFMRSGSKVWCNSAL